MGIMRAKGKAKGAPVGKVSQKGCWERVVITGCAQKYLWRSSGKPPEGEAEGDSEFLSCTGRKLFEDGSI